MDSGSHEVICTQLVHKRPAHYQFLHFPYILLHPAQVPRLSAPALSEAGPRRVSRLRSSSSSQIDRHLSLTATSAIASSSWLVFTIAASRTDAYIKQPEAH